MKTLIFQYLSDKCKAWLNLLFLQALSENMKELVQNFPVQLRQALEIGENAKLRKHSAQIQNVLITGLGGSGIGGSILSEIVSSECPVPVCVNKDYFMPGFVGQHTLVIVSSYSGNTEETLYALDEAIRRKAKIVCITSGGKVAELAVSHDLDIIIIPGGMPPRSCLGYSLTQLFYVMSFFDLTGDNFRTQIASAIRLLEQEGNEIKNEAKQITDFLSGKIPVIYCVDGFGGVATRFRQQINENSKMLCWHHVLPEMNHNELVGWAENHPDCAVVILRNETDYSRTQARIEISKEVFNRYSSGVKEIWSKGKSTLERSLYLIHLTDWVSCYLADKKNVDANEINIINHLKGELSKI